METELSVTSKGQITIKKDFLSHLGIRPGEKINMQALPNGELRLKATKTPTRSIKDFFGILARESDVCLTIEEINEVIQKGWAGELKNEDNG